MNEIKFMGSLKSQRRDDEDAVTIQLAIPASEFNKVINIPTRTLLEITVSFKDSSYVNPLAESPDTGDDQSLN